MFSVTLLAHLALVPARLQKQRAMEWMLRFYILMACFALDGSDMFLVRHIPGIKTRVAGDADQFLVRRMTQNFIVHEQ